MLRKGDSSIAAKDKTSGEYGCKFKVIELTASLGDAEPDDDAAKVWTQRMHQRPINVASKRMPSDAINES